jgi:hypothetical protein
VKTEAWQWVDTRGSVTSKYTLVRFGAGTLSDGTTETAFTFGEATIEDPQYEQFQTLRGPVFLDAWHPSRVNITLHGAPDIAPLKFGGAELALAADGFAVSTLFITSGDTTGDTWNVRAAAGEATVSVEPQPGPPRHRSLLAVMEGE